MDLDLEGSPIALNETKPKQKKMEILSVEKTDFKTGASGLGENN